MFSGKAKGSDLQRESARGDGNCAFNAFILALTNKEVLDSIEEFINKDPDAPPPDYAFFDFIRPVAEKFGIELKNIESKDENEKWNAIKDKLLEIRAANSDRLQRELAPIIRNLAMDQVERNPISNQIHLEGSLNALQDEFKAYLEEWRRIQRETGASSLTDEKVFGELDKVKELIDTSRVGEIFYPHEFIQDQFNAALIMALISIGDIPYGFDPQEEDNIILTSVLPSLADWWKKEGHETFISEMRASAKSAADTRLYASDLELAPLARFFNIDLTVTHPRFGYNLLVNSHGKIPFDSQEAKAIENEEKDYFKNKLTEKGADVIRQVGVNQYEFLPLPREEVVKRLTAKGCSESIKQNFLKIWDENYKVCAGVVLAHGGDCRHWDNMRKPKGETDEEMALRLQAVEFGELSALGIKRDSKS
ncbi:MAG: hypothetical protein ACYCQI_06690 [Gammaproteobacteria bacterium]